MLDLENRQIHPIAFHPELLYTSISRWIWEGSSVDLEWSL